MALERRQVMTGKCLHNKYKRYCYTAVNYTYCKRNYMKANCFFEEISLLYIGRFRKLHTIQHF